MIKRARVERRIDVDTITLAHMPETLDLRGLGRTYVRADQFGLFESV
ncbi:hypothetical protein [Paraburkholderia sp. PGU19]|nr:hypothetical protein [Paraburkholderia sp. PGU19]